MTTNQLSEEDLSLLVITQEPNTPQWLTEEEIAELYEDSLITNVPFYRAEGFAREVERLTISKLQADRIREAFEKWVCSPDSTFPGGQIWLVRNEDGDYSSPHTQDHWLTWQAARAKA